LTAAARAAAAAAAARAVVAWRTTVRVTPHDCAARQAIAVDI
jgi:hypothetical protein